MKKAFIVFADGFEEVEALCVVDLLRRAEVEILMVSLDGIHEVTGSHGITLVMDDTLEHLSIEDFDAVILPGGMPGTTNLRNSKKLKKIILKMNEKQKIIAAICAAPTVLNDAGILESKKVTSYPSFEDDFKESLYCLDSVVEDGNIVTSRGLGTAIDFSLALIRKLISAEVAYKIKSAIIYEK